MTTLSLKDLQDLSDKLHDKYDRLRTAARETESARKCNIYINMANKVWSELTEVNNRIIELA